MPSYMTSPEYGVNRPWASAYIYLGLNDDEILAGRAVIYHSDDFQGYAVFGASTSSIEELIHYMSGTSCFIV